MDRVKLNDFIFLFIMRLCVLVCDRNRVSLSNFDYFLDPC